MKIAATMVVKNEGDIIGATLDALSTQVDKIFIVDNESTDNTVEIASRYKNTVIHSMPGAYNHPLAHKQMIKMAQSYDWVVCVDGDEIWSNIKAVEKYRMYDTVKVTSINNFMLLTDSPTFDVKNFAYYKTSDITRHPRIIFKPVVGGQLRTVGEGSHDNGSKNWAETKKIRVDHYPMRSVEQYKKKITNGCNSLLQRKTSKVATHWFRWYNLLEQGIFHQEMESKINMWRQRML